MKVTMRKMEPNSKKRIKKKTTNKVKVMNHQARKMLKMNLQKINKDSSLIWKSFMSKISS